jgi:hypothetical protein
MGLGFPLVFNNVTLRFVFILTHVFGEDILYAFASLPPPPPPPSNPTQHILKPSNSLARQLIHMNAGYFLITMKLVNPKMLA